MTDEILDPQVGYVVEIPDNKTVIVNVGSDDGFKKGDKLVIYEKGPEITDSKTNEILGRKDYIKESVEIVEVYPRFSECQRLVTKERSSFATVATMVQGSTYKVAADLPIRPDQNKEWKMQKPRIEINDPVKNA